MALGTSITGRVLRRTSRPWEMEGRAGITNRLLVMTESFDLVFVEVDSVEALRAYEIGSVHTFSGSVGKTAQLKVSILDTREETSNYAV